MKAVLLAAAIVLSSMQASLADDLGRKFFGFELGATKAEIASAFEIAPNEPSAYRNAFVLKGQPKATIKSIKNINYTITLYFSDDDTLIRVLARLSDHTNLENPTIKGAVAPFIFSKIVSILDESYQTINNKISDKIQKYIECGKACEGNSINIRDFSDYLIEQCEKTKRDSMFFYTQLSGMNFNNTTEDLLTAISYCTKKASSKYFSSNYSEIIATFRATDLRQAAVSVEACLKSQDFSGCDDVAKKYMKKREQAF